MITLLTTPAYTINDEVSPIEISRLVATEAQVLFQFQRSEGDILSAAVDPASPSMGTLLQFGAGYTISVGDLISIYDSGTDSMLSATVLSDEGSDCFVVDLDWVDSYSNDLIYIINLTQRQNYYLQARLKINDVYESITIRSTASPKGIIKLYIQDYLQSKISSDKIGSYTSTLTAETNQSGSFELEYRERYDGDGVTDETYTSEGNIWYYVYAIRTKEQGCNLYEYVGTDTQEAIWFNEFDRPVWSLGLPNDIQFWWNPVYAALSLTRKHYSSDNVEISSTVEALDTGGIGYLCSIRVDSSTVESECAYIVLSIDEP